MLPAAIPDRLPPKLVGCGRRDSRAFRHALMRSGGAITSDRLLLLQFFNNSIEKRPALQDFYLRQDLVFRRTGARHGRPGADVLHVQEVIVKALDLQSRARLVMRGSAGFAEIRPLTQAPWPIPQGVCGGESFCQYSKQTRVFPFEPRRVCRQPEERPPELDRLRPFRRHKIPDLRVEFNWGNLHGALPE